MSATILIVEDEYAVARGVQYALQQEGYAVTVARSGEEGLEFATQQAPDLVILDVRLPGMDGFEVLRRLRSTGSKAPVLFLTARDDEVDKVIGLELGADDYLTKPFGLRELMSRIKALLRRAYGDLSDAVGGRIIRHRDLVIDLERRRVQRGDRRIALTATEFDILRHLASRPGRVYTRPELLELIRDYERSTRTRRRSTSTSATSGRSSKTTRQTRPSSSPSAASATRSPSAEGRPTPMRTLRRFLRRILPRTFRARLTLAFAAVVAIALALVLAALPRLLDDYFQQQEQKSLASRASIMAPLIQLQLRNALALGSADPHPIVLPTDPATISPEAAAALGAPDDPNGFLYTLTAIVAQSDVKLEVALSADEPLRLVDTLDVPATMIKPGLGQARDPIPNITVSFVIEDGWWSVGGRSTDAAFLAAPFAAVHVPQQAIRDVVGVLILATAIALLVAVVASAVIADRLTGPIRRLTQASRSLGEGDFGARVSAGGSGAPEVTELAGAFNRMAERLEESVTFIRRDRDRSRDFLADVSHELRTPIAALRTFNELLQEGAVEDPAARGEFLESSRQQIERLDWLATNLLELSKLDSGLVALDLRPDDLRAVVESAISQAEPAAKRRGVELVAELPAEPVRQRHDPQRVGQVLSNLVGNALKFTPAGGRVAISLKAVRDGADLRVSDTGVGIDSAELPHVFDRFYRGSRAMEQRAGGSGLGLAIVRSIVEMHGGRVTVTSKLGRGTEVTVHLPREVTQSSPAGGRG